MAARVGRRRPRSTRSCMPGTHFLTPAEALEALRPKGDGLDSLYGIGKVADEFNVANKVYAQPQPVDDVHRRSLSKRRSQVRRSPRARTELAPGAARSMRDRGRGRSRGCRRGSARSCWACWRSCCRSLLWCARQLRAVHLASAGARRATPGDVDLVHAGHAGRARGVRRARTPSSRAQRAAAGDGRARQPGLPAGAARGGARAVTAFTTPPAPPDEPWLHESLLAQHPGDLLGLLLSSLVGVPLGILCGTFRRSRGSPSRSSSSSATCRRRRSARSRSRCSASTTRPRSRSSSSARSSSRCWSSPTPRARSTRAARGGADAGRHRAGSCCHAWSCRASCPTSTRDMRILLGWAWTYLIVAELIGDELRHHLLHQPAGDATATTTTSTPPSS